MKKSLLSLNVLVTLYNTYSKFKFLHIHVYLKFHNAEMLYQTLMKFSNYESWNGNKTICWLYITLYGSLQNNNILLIRSENALL